MTSAGQVSAGDPPRVTACHGHAGHEAEQADEEDDAVLRPQVDARRVERDRRVRGEAPVERAHPPPVSPRVPYGGRRGSRERSMAGWIRRCEAGFGGGGIRDRGVSWNPKAPRVPAPGGSRPSMAPGTSTVARKGGKRPGAFKDRPRAGRSPQDRSQRRGGAGPPRGHSWEVPRGSWRPGYPGCPGVPEGVQEGAARKVSRKMFRKRKGGVRQKRTPPSRSTKRSMRQTARTCEACGPFWPWVISNSTRWPSSRLR